jgi:hypothetical protein
MKSKALNSILVLSIVFLMYGCFSNNTESKPVLTGENLRIDQQRDTFNYKLQHRSIAREIFSEFSFPDNKDEWIKRFGKPDNDDVDSLSYKQKGLFVSYGKENCDFYVITAPCELKTNSGIGIGSLADDVITAYYGHIDPMFSKVDNGKGRICVGHFRSVFSIQFDIENHRVVKIYNGCRFD